MSKSNRAPNESDPICQAPNCPKPDRHFVPTMKSRPQKYHDNECKGLAMVTKVWMTCITCSRRKEVRPDAIHEWGWQCADCYNHSQITDELERFLSKTHGGGTEPAHRPGIGPCGEWTGTFDKKGYAVFNLSGQDKQVMAARYALSLIGPIPEDLCACHRCDNPRCVLSDPPGTFMLNEVETPCWGHLFWGTKEDNSNDMVEKGRQAKGIANGNAKLNDDVVRESRLLYATGGVTQQELADAVGISQQSMGAMLRGETWRHVV